MHLNIGIAAYSFKGFTGDNQITVAVINNIIILRICSGLVAFAVGENRKTFVKYHIVNY